MIRTASTRRDTSIPSGFAPRPPRRAVHAGGWLGVAAVFALAACSGSGSDAAPPALTSTDRADTVAAPVSAGTPISSATESTPPTAATQPTPPTTAPPAAQQSGSDECPTETVVSAAIGTDMAIDPNPPRSAPGFCPYNASDGTGSVTASVTFTQLDLTQDPGAGPSEPVDGLGERATWSMIGDLTVWTGNESILITINVLGPGHDDIDARDASIALAEQIIAGTS